MATDVATTVVRLDPWRWRGFSRVTRIHPAEVVLNARLHLGRCGWGEAGDRTDAVDG